MAHNPFASPLAADSTVPERELYAEREEQAQFLVRTYGHLVGAIVAFIGIEAFLLNSGAGSDLLQVLMGLPWMVILGGFLLVSWLASSIAARTASVPLQYLALGGFVVAEAVIFLPMLAYAEYKVGGGVIGSAALVTLLGFAGLTGIVFYTRKDFSFLRPFLMFVFVLALVGIAVSLIFGFELGTWFSVAMIVFAGGAILYDTSNILHHYPRDRHVAAALSLFASVALLFWYVLRLFMARD